MAPLKFVIKCGNFAVLVDLHILPLGGQKDTSWFTTGYVEEVTALVRDAVDQRVKQHTQLFHNRKQFKLKKELPPASAFFVKGNNFNLAANFLKRHFNLRCVAKHLYKDLRVFPERYVVCVSSPEDASAHHGNPSPGATKLSEQSRSEYFSKVGETQEPLNNPTKTKKTVLQKIARKAHVQRELSGSSLGKQQTDQRSSPRDVQGEFGSEDTESSPKKTVLSSRHEVLQKANHMVPFPSAATESVGHIGTTQKRGLIQEQQTENSAPDSIKTHKVTVDYSQQETTQESSKSKRCKPVDPGEDPHQKHAKRMCFERPQVTMQNESTECSTKTSKHDLPLLPIPPVEAKADSKAFPVTECKKTTLEVELLTPGKRAQRLPLTSNNTAQTNQNRLAASLRGLSVKPASSGSSISSRSTLGEEGGANVPRTSRLRRPRGRDKLQ